MRLFGWVEPATLRLRTISDVALPGNTSRFDYVSLDADAYTALYVSHLGASQVVVVDTTTLTVEQTLDNVGIGTRRPGPSVDQQDLRGSDRQRPGSDL